MPCMAGVSSALSLAGDSCELLCNHPALGFAAVSARRPAGQLGVPGPALALQTPPGAREADCRVHTLQGQDSKCLCLGSSHLTSGDMSKDHHLFTKLSTPDALLEAYKARAVTPAGTDACGVQRPTAKLAFFAELLLTTSRPQSQGQHSAGAHSCGSESSLCSPWAASDRSKT